MYSLGEATVTLKGKSYDLAFGTRGRVTGPASSGEEKKLLVAFEGGAGRWNMYPTQLSRTRYDRNEDVVYIVGPSLVPSLVLCLVSPRWRSGMAIAVPPDAES